MYDSSDFSHGWKLVTKISSAGFTKSIWMYAINGNSFCYLVWKLFSSTQKRCDIFYTIIIINNDQRNYRFHVINLYITCQQESFQVFHFYNISSERFWYEMRRIFDVQFEPHESSLIIASLHFYWNAIGASTIKLRFINPFIWYHTWS